MPIFLQIKKLVSQLFSNLDCKMFLHNVSTIHFQSKIQLHKQVSTNQEKDLATTPGIRISILCIN